MSAIEPGMTAKEPYMFAIETVFRKRALYSRESTVSFRQTERKHRAYNALVSMFPLHRAYNTCMFSLHRAYNTCIFPLHRAYNTLVSMLG